MSRNRPIQLGIHTNVPNLSRLHRPTTLTALSRFRYVKLPIKSIYAGAVRLQGGGNIKLEALRKPKPRTEIKEKESAKEAKQDNWFCQTQAWTADSITQEAAILNPNYQSMYPGAIYPFESIADGSYKPVPGPRKPITVVVDGVNFTHPAVTIQTPSKATIQQAVAKIKQSQKIQGGARTYGHMFKVLSEEDLFIRSGGSGYFLGFGGSHQVSFGSQNKSHRYFISVVQAYYTISVDDSVSEPGHFFVLKSEAPTRNDALDDKQVDPNWTYVESVTYGRIAQILFESDEALETVGIDVSAHAHMLVAGGEGSFNMEQRSLLKRTSITVATIGGSAQAAAKLLNANFSDLRQRIDEYFMGSQDEVPIAYSLRTLDGDPVGMRMMTEFTSRHCAPLASHYRVTCLRAQCELSDDGGGQAEEARLMVRIRAWDGKGNDILDVDRKNKSVVETAAIHRKTPATKNLVPMPWTFTDGNRQHPVVFRKGTIVEYENKWRLSFPIPVGDSRARLGIRVDVLEYDDTSADDDFKDDTVEFKLAEVTGARNVSLRCTHDNSRIRFDFLIEPLYQN